MPSIISPYHVVCVHSSGRFLFHEVDGPCSKMLWRGSSSQQRSLRELNEDDQQKPSSVADSCSGCLRSVMLHYPSKCAVRSEAAM
jgi:hypothetical protein